MLRFANLNKIDLIKVETFFVLYQGIEKFISKGTVIRIIEFKLYLKRKFPFIFFLTGFINIFSYIEIKGVKSKSSKALLYI